MKQYFHCCKKMIFFLNEKKVAIFYEPKFRTYYIELKHSSALQEIYFCPWCGKKLPKGLQDEWVNQLDNLGIDFDMDALEDLPVKYQTDEWWLEQDV